MKRINIFASLLVGVLCFTACETDRDDNPVIDLSHTQAPIHLNTPTFANSTYDFANSDTITLACTAPSFGFPTTVTYAIELSLDADMTNPTKLTSTYYKNQMQVPGKELAIATTKQLITKRGLAEEDFPIVTPAYIRIHSYIDGIQNTDSYSNIVKLTNVKTKFALPDVAIPESFYVNGAFTNNNWEDAVPTIPVHSNLDTHWRICWIDRNGIQTSPVKGAPNYADDWITVSYVCQTPGFNVDADGKITTNNAGWYTMVIEGKPDNAKRTLRLTFSFEKAEVWLIGTSVVNDEAISSDNTVVPDAIVNDDKAKNSCWNESNLRKYFESYVKFETPTTMNGEFISPQLTSAVKGDGGTRAYAKVKSFDWWKTEFFVFKKGSQERGDIAYRGNGEDQERVNGTKGQRVYFRFSDDTGALK